MKLSELFEKKTSATAWVIMYTDKKLILGKRAPGVNNPNQWNFFGGHVDDGEAPAIAAARELEEETGYKIDPKNLRQVSNLGNVYYFAAKINDPGSVNTTDEISKVKTFKLTDLPDNLHSKTQTFFDNLEELLT